MAFSFGTQGATPGGGLFAGISNPTNILGLGGSSTPASKALSSAVQTTTPQTGNTPNIFSSAPPAPTSQPVKSHSVTDASGNTVTQTYHPPETSNSQSSSKTYTTPSGAVVNEQGGLISSPTAPVASQSTSAPQSPQNSTQNSTQNTQPPTFPGLLQILQDLATKGSPQVQEANQNLADFKKKLAGTYADIENTPIPLEFQQGREQVVGRQAAAEQAALETEVQNALSGQGQQISGLTSALGAASPQLGNIGSQQFYNPLNAGQGGGSGLPQQAQDFVNSLAEQVKNGAMTRADAESRLNAYGITGVQALNTALGSGFNTNASNASAGTTAIGQQIKTAADSTNKALDTLGSAFANLSPLQTAGIPASNSIANWIATQFGDQALTQFKTNLADARSQLIGVLNSAGGTPTGNEATAMQYLPDNMTKAQFDANVGTADKPGIVRQLIAQKVASFTSSGQQNTSGGTGGSSIWSW